MAQPLAVVLSVFPKQAEFVLQQVFISPPSQAIIKPLHLMPFPEYSLWA